MKSQRLLLHLLLLTLLCPVSQMVGAQEPKKPKIATSSNAQTTYKPLEKTIAEKSKSVPKNNTAKGVVPKNTVPAKKVAKVDGTKKQMQAKKKSVVKNQRSQRYVALKTNIPFQALAVHNLAVEVQTHKHVTIDFPVIWSISDIEREHAVRGIAFQPEGRWWLKNVGEGHFLGIHAHAAWFNMKWIDNRYQTEKCPLLGAGVSYGYKLPFSSHWGVEFNVGAGYAKMKYDTYYNIENGAKLDKRIRNYWGITRAGISLVYRF